MRPDIADLKAAVDFRGLVSETHEINRDGKTLCPFHDDHNSSLHVYPDGFKCFSCGAHGDAVDWLEAVHGLTTAEAMAELRRRAGEGHAPRPQRRFRPPAPVAESCKARPIPADVLASHMRRAARLDRLPLALQGRGFTLEDARALRMAAERDDLLFTVSGPDGVVLAIKKRLAHPGAGQRYTYMLPGHGAPAWCSPGFRRRGDVLVIEGELNGMACWLAWPDLAVMGAAGANGGLHLEALRGRTVYVYADGDEAGDKARERWARAAYGAGASKVYLLEPWEADACDIAGVSRSALVSALEHSLAHAQVYTPPADKPAPATRRPRTYRAGVYARLRGWR